MFIKVTDAIEWIETSHRFRHKESLENIKAALDLLGNPQDSFKSIHIGGTNGKGSTSCYTFNILKESGYKTGLFISPYVIKFNERISIDGEYISDERLLEIANKVYDFNEEFKKSHDPLSFFEICTIIAFIYFKEEKVDFAVIEVGMGGRLDSTNVLKPLVSAVTNIQKDHMKQLGNTYKKILVEKLGIMKEGIPFITTIERRELIPIIKDYSLRLNSPLYLVRGIRNVEINDQGTFFTFMKDRYQSSLIGIHQSKNASLSIEIIKILNEFYGYNISKNAIQKGLLNTRWPGRFELISKDVIIDGAHNKEGLEALKMSLNAFTNKKISLVFCCMKDKDTKEMVKIIDSFASSIIFTGIDYHRSDTGSHLSDISTISNKIVEPDYEQAIKIALESKKSDEVVVFSGSLYFISRVREKLLGGQKC